MECTRICKRTIQNGSLTDTDCLIATCLYLHHQRHTASIASTCDDDIHKHNSLTAIQLHTKPLPAMIHAVSLLHPRFSPQHPGSLDNGYRGAVGSLARIHTAEGFYSKASTLHRSYPELCVVVEVRSIDHRDAIESICFAPMDRFVSCLLCFV